MPQDWLVLINKRAAIKEQFPSLARIRHERPGSEQDRDNRARFQIENQMSVKRARAAVGVRDEQEKDADRFITEMRRREQERFLARMAARTTDRRAS